MSCELFYYSGIGECKALRESISAMIPMTKKQTLTLAGAATLTGWKAALVPVAGMQGLVIDLKRGYEITSDEAEMTSSPLGYVEKTRENPPKMTGYANMSYEDYKLWFAADGKAFEIVLPLENGNVLGTKTSAGAFKGFRGRLFMKYNPPKIGADLQQECKFEIIFDNLEEWKNIVEVSTDFTAEELLDINPIGLDVSIITAYAAGGDLVVQVNYRGESRPYAGLTTNTKWNVIRALANVGSTITITSAANAALGQYTVNFQDGTPSDFTDDFYIQGINDDATYITYLSNVLQVAV